MDCTIDTPCDELFATGMCPHLDTRSCEACGSPHSEEIEMVRVGMKRRYTLRCEDCENEWTHESDVPLAELVWVPGDPEPTR